MLLTALCAIGIASVALRAVANDTPAKEEQRGKYLAQMKGLAESTVVSFKGATRKPLLTSKPVFRYDDQPLRFIDATMWVWTENGRPVAFEKIEAMIHRETGEPQWGYCFTSAAEGLLSVEWSDSKRFESKEPGIAFQALNDAPAVGAGDAARKRQARELSRGFAARLVLDPRKNETQELRLLPTPVMEYTDPKTNRYMGSVFVYSANGTNPTLLMLFEPREADQQTRWHFAPARMTSGGVKVSFADKQIWETPFVEWYQAPFATWTFFQTPRTPLPGEQATAGP
jgi:hypothetical protein